MSKKGKKNSITVSDVVSSVYCERKALFDYKHGRSIIGQNRRLAKKGNADHDRYEAHGKVVRDSRCFIATAAFGPTSIEVNILRSWRDRCLMKNAPGRAFVSLYYTVSPLIASLIDRSSFFRSVVRGFLISFIRWSKIE